MSEPRREVPGSLFALGAFLSWGAAPLYFRELRHVPAIEIVAHRVAWSALLLLLVSALLRRMDHVVAVLRRPRTLAALVLSAALIGVNWLLFVWSIETGRLLQVSLGYFTNPLVSIALGAAFLGETLSSAQRAAVVVAGGSVLWLGISAGQVPWIAMALAVTFGFYGLLRKVMRVDALTGLLVEAWLLWPLAVAWLILRHRDGTGAFRAVDGATDVLLVLSGVVTAIPLLCFVAAARRLTLTAVGFFQYLAPSLQFLIAVLLWKEPFDARRLVAFCGIWLALAIVSVDALRPRLTSGGATPRP